MAPYLCQDLLRKSLGDLEEIGLDAGLLKTFLFSFSELLDMSTARRGCQHNLFEWSAVHVQRRLQAVLTGQSCEQCVRVVLHGPDVARIQCNASGSFLYTLALWWYCIHVQRPVV
jgi:hypothetical protein